MSKPREGIHSFRILDIAVADVALTVAAAAGISYFTQWNFWVVFISLILIGIVTHRALKIRTKVDTIIFPNV